jgi:hypothetical protein
MGILTACVYMVSRYEYRLAIAPHKNEKDTHNSALVCTFLHCRHHFKRRLGRGSGY